MGNSEIHKNSYKSPGAPERWLDRPENINRIVYALYLLCAIFVLLDSILPRHSVFFFEAWFGFYAWFGFIGCVGLVLGAKLLRRILIRPEDYYD
ncbi:MAG: hypothetical protein ACOY2B_03415 [Pseudomonadota bacterium]